MKSFKKHIFLILLVLSAFIFSSCIYSVKEFPDDDLDLEWEEITLDEAKELFLSYQFENHKKAKVYERFPGNKIRKFPNCKITQSGSVYYINVIQMTFPVTVDTEDLKSDSTYYKAASDSAFIKIIPAEEGDSDDFFIYENGWLVEHLLVTNGPDWHDFCDDLIIYKD